MLICLFGPPRAGKQSVIRWLCDQHKFTELRFAIATQTPGPRSAANNPKLPSFSSAEELMEFVMADHRWQQDWAVVLPESLCDGLAVIKRRPFSLCILIDGPLMLRFSRFELDSNTLHHRPSLEEFVEQNDRSLFTGTRVSIGRLADMIIINDFPELASFRAYLCSINPSLVDKTRLRPSWDDYFLLLADLAAHRSNCMKRRVGCIIVRDCRVIASGYNGTARGLKNCNEGGCDRCNKAEARCGQGLGECLCLHAEENALLEIGRLSGNGASLYCNTCPCLSCAKKIIQTGVKEVIYRMDYGMDEISTALFKEAGVILRKHSTTMELTISNNLTPI